ncbi:porin [Azohydromonas aeria]|uniref:porin n=1 Tax=Azohydromonas aeria TaxID=2590212 RepID=UPI0012F983ED|nr:porin [Azohydromonas aeria]
MKKLILKPTLIAAAVLAVAPLAQAQSNVTLYGRVDLGIQHSNRSAAADDGKTELYNGGILPSIWGLRGTEDLGSGLSAFFNLESHFSADTGIGVNGLFRRQANVGLKGAWGAVALGRQYSPALLAHLATDPRGMKEQHSMLYPYALNQLTVPVANNDIGVFLGNAISYTNSFGPVNVGAAYAFGEVAGESKAGRTLSLGGSYTGPVTVSASYQQITTVADTGDTKQFGLGAAVPVGPVKVKALYLRTKSDDGVLTGAGGPETNVNVWGVGVDYAWGANTTTLAYYQGKDKDADDDKTKTLVLSNDYALSKRTTLYAQLAYADANAGATFRTSISSAQPAPDKKTTTIGLGVKHDF